MKFYLDSADARQWALPAGCPPVQGVTTNPTLVMQAGLPVSLAGYLKLVAQAGEARIPELMLQLPRADVGEAAQWLEVLLPAAVQARVRLTIKLPCHPDWQPVLREVQAYLAHRAPVGEHLADQLMIPMALAALQGKLGQYWATSLSEHTRTNARVIEQFLQLRFVMEPLDGGTLVQVNA